MRASTICAARVREAAAQRVVSRVERRRQHARHLMSRMGCDPHQQGWRGGGATCGGSGVGVGGVWRRSRPRRRCVAAAAAAAALCGGDSGGGGGSPQHVRARKRGRWDVASDAPVGERRERSRPLADTTKCRGSVGPSEAVPIQGIILQRRLRLSFEAVSDVLKVTSKSRLEDESSL